MQTTRQYDLKPANTRAVAGQIAHEVVQYGLSTGWPDPVEELWIGDEINTLSVVLNPLNIYHIEDLPGAWAFLLNSNPALGPNQAISDLIRGQQYGLKHLLTILNTVLSQATLAFATAIVAERIEDERATDPTDFESWLNSVVRQIATNIPFPPFFQAEHLAVTVLYRLAGMADIVQDAAGRLPATPALVIKVRQRIMNNE